MKVWLYVAAGFTALCTLLLLLFLLKGRKPFKTALLNIVFGLVGLAAVDLTTVYTGAHIPVNPGTAAGCAVFGLPAVCGFLLLRLML